MEQLLTDSCIIDENDDFTTSVNRFDPSLVKQGYYYLLTLPYKGAGTLKDAPQGLDSIDAEFIQNASKLYKNTLESENIAIIDKMVEEITQIANDFWTNRQLRKEEVEKIFKVTSTTDTKYSKENWTKTTRDRFQFACHLSLVSQFFEKHPSYAPYGFSTSGEKIEYISEVQPIYQDMFEWVDDVINSEVEL